jgi:sulfopyruvate decarboxylase alpha subunit
MTDSSTQQPWAHDIFDALQGLGVRQAAYVPDAGHANLIDLCQDTEAIRTVPLTTEEEGVALVAGAWLGGEPGVLLMQSSGVGNCINMLALVRECRFPLLMLVTMRGQSGESNPWQVPMGQATATVLREIGVIVHPVDDSAQLGATVAAAGKQAFDTNGAAAVLIAQRIVGFKTFATQETG